jgi:hypothetical protein
MPSLTIAAQPSSGNPFTAWLNPLQQTHHPWQQWATANNIHLPIWFGGMLEVNAFLLGLCFPNPVNCLIVLQ